MSIVQEPKQKLDDKELRVAFYVEQLFNQYGRLPSNQRLAQGLEAYDVDLAFINKCFTDSFFLRALHTRGLPVDLVSASPEEVDQKLVQQEKSDVLSPEQMMLISSLLNFDDVRTHREKLKAMNIKQVTYQNWLKQKKFKEYFTKQLWARFADADNLAIQQLLVAVSSGDTQAIKMFLEMRGHYTKTINVDFNPVTAINKIVEIIARYVAPEVFDVIADEIERQVFKRQVALPGVEEITSTIEAEIIHERDQTLRELQQSSSG